MFEPPVDPNSKARLVAIHLDEVSIGRGNPNDVRLDADEYASAQHARVEPRRDGVWIEDVGSTNGTYVNGVRLSRPRKLAVGDLVRVGETDLRFEE